LGKKNNDEMVQTQGPEEKKGKSKRKNIAQKTVKRLHEQYLGLHERGRGRGERGGETGGKTADQIQQRGVVTSTGATWIVGTPAFEGISVRVAKMKSIRLSQDGKKWGVTKRIRLKDFGKVGELSGGKKAEQAGETREGKKRPEKQALNRW